MNEVTKSIVFVVVGLACLAAFALASRLTHPDKPVLTAEEMIGQVLFDGFTDPLTAKSMEIVEYDEETGESHVFEVAEVDGKYCIPSHANYPADAEDQLADAAASMIGIKVLGVASDSPADHGLYGVLDPDPKVIKPGAVGVGTRVTMKDAEDKVLLGLVIGKEVEGQPELRFVRCTGQDPVYTAQVSTGKLSTTFEDWIEKDLLKLSAFDIKQIQMKDYSIVSVNLLQKGLENRSDVTVEYDSAGNPPWQLVTDKVWQDGDWVSLPMADDEELDKDKLNDLKNALDDLKIVDVARKPEGLSANLKATKSFAEDAEALTSLVNRGFYVVPVSQDDYELLSNDGEVRCVMNDGVEYVLRFGDLAENSNGSSEGEADTEANRYIFVMTEFNPDVIPKPELDPLPEAPAKAAEEPEAAEADTETTDETAAAEEATEDSAEKAGNEAAAADDKTSEDSAESEKDDLAVERERVEKENQRKQDEYDQKIADGKKKAEELNARFADWYYVISDDVYKKIHLSRDQIIKKKEAAENGDSGEAMDAHDHAEDGLGDSHDHSADEPETPLGEFDNLDMEGPEGE